MLTGVRGIDGLDRLDVRLMGLLGLALLPIGIIAMVQTYRVIDEADTKAEAALMGATITAAATERERILRMRGASQFGAALAGRTLDDPEGCSRSLRDFVNANSTVSFAGFVGIDGIVLCASSGVGSDLSTSEVYRDYIQERRPTITALRGTISRRSVVVITEPVKRGETDLGYLAISVPRRALDYPRDPVAGLTPLLSITFTPEGEFLITGDESNARSMAAAIPADRSLTALTGGEPLAFTAQSKAGVERVYTVAPLIPNEIYAMSVWPAGAIHTSGLTAASAILFPLLMCLVSIGVAYFAVHRLVVRHIRHLRMQIRAFTANRKVLAAGYGNDTPSELREVIETFHQMTERIVRDEADLENSIHEKDVLLKEVHHRVKNNLQLISSMINMQLRKSKSRDTDLILRRLQDRIMGLAMIHRNLYQASVLSRVDSGKLISDLVTQVVCASDLGERGIEPELDVENVPLYPDQAVPLSLLVTETLTNAVRYVGKDASDRAWVRLTLRRDDDGTVVLKVANSTGTAVNPDGHDYGTGLGAQLMAAFVMQLDAKSAIAEGDGKHEVEVTFRPSDFTVET